MIFFAKKLPKERIKPTLNDDQKFQLKSSTNIFYKKCENFLLVVAVSLCRKALVSGARSALSFCLSVSARGAQKFRNERERERT